MNILHINSYYATSKFYKNLFDEQKKHNISISVYVPVANSFKNDDFDYGDYTILSKTYAAWKRAVFYFKHNDILADIEDKFVCTKFDLIHAHSWFSNGYIAYKLNKKYAIPYVVAVRNTDINVFYKYMWHLRKMGLEILDNAEKIIFISPKYRDYLVSNLNDKRIKDGVIRKSVVLPNGVDDFWIKNKQKYSISKNEDIVKILYVGNIDENKNLLTTSRAIDLLINDGIDVLYTVAGKVCDKKVLKALETKKYFNYLGVLNKEQLLSVYRDNDIFVMPSYTETFGIAYLEALSQGLPILYSKGQGFDGWFDDGVVGYPVDSSNYRDVYAKIKILLADIVKPPPNVVEKFTWENITNHYNLLYKKVVGHT